MVLSFIVWRVCMIQLWELEALFPLLKVLEISSQPQLRLHQLLTIFYNTKNHDETANVIAIAFLETSLYGVVVLVLIIVWCVVFRWCALSWGWKHQDFCSESSWSLQCKIQPDFRRTGGQSNNSFEETQ